MLKPNNGFWAPFDHNTLLRTCSLLHGSPSSSAPPPCGGTSIYMGAHKDDWIITLAQFAVDQHNHKESKHLRYVRVVGASHTTVSSILYHITINLIKYSIGRCRYLRRTDYFAYAEKQTDINLTVLELKLHKP